MFSGSVFKGVVWNHGASIMLSCFDHCTLTRTSFNETVVNAVFRSCEICEGAFDNIVEMASEIDICGPTKTGQRIVAGKGQDPLEDVRVAGWPRVEQLKELDALLATEHLEEHFQKFLERNPQLLLLAVNLGHHGTYVVPQVRFGGEFVAGFMIGAKNSMGCFWTGLEIESPRHPVVKSDEHFTVITNHAISIRSAIGGASFARTPHWRRHRAIKAVLGLLTLIQTLRFGLSRDAIVTDARSERDASSTWSRARRCTFRPGTGSENASRKLWIALDGS